MIRAHHWIGAVLLAALAHIAVFALLAFNPPKGTAAAQGEMGIEIDLGMLGDLYGTCLELRDATLVVRC